MEDHQLHKEQEYESGVPIQEFIDNDMKCAKAKELFENGEKHKDCCYLPILKSGEH